MARKAFAANDAMRERVRYLAGVGVPQDDIAKIIGCAPKTLRKRFRADLDRGVAEANATMCGFLFAAAKAGSIPAMIFWLKTRAHWQEKVTLNDPIVRADAASNSPVVLVLPDNSRDPGLTRALLDAQEKYFGRKPRRQPQLGPEVEAAPVQTESTVGILPDVVVTRLLTTSDRRPQQLVCDECRCRQQQRSRRSPDRRPSSCEPRPTSASMAVPRVAGRPSG